MAKLEQSTNDSITVAERTIADIAIPAELPSDIQAIEPLDVEEAQPVRRKLRTYATLLALYVIYSSTSSKDQVELMNTPARLLHHRSRSNHRRNFNPHNLHLSKLCLRLHLDRRRIPTRQRSSRSHLG
jgi:hypothetical protein